MKNKPLVCPWWAGRLLANPLRRIIHNPEKITGPYIKEGSLILEIGPGMGFFSLPMARLAGETGKVYCVDIQEKMLSVLRKKTEKAGLSQRIITRISAGDSLNILELHGRIDFCLLFAVAHEIPDQKKLFSEIFNSLRENGILFFSEPAGHVTKNEFSNSLDYAREAGFTLKNELKIP
ncbi:MAG TPA: class I SAM-dependent methyltransferase [Spirochaetota bacterium]|nr:class I SAM-dependent methyltransferase [Spirochaetota bacterium]